MDFISFITILITLLFVLLYFVDKHIYFNPKISKKYVKKSNKFNKILDKHNGIILINKNGVNVHFNNKREKKKFFRKIKKSNKKFYKRYK